MPSVLIIDDSLLIRIGLKQLIGEEYRGTAFGEAKTGSEGLVLFSKQAWDLVILDISLPDEDAFSLLQEICRHDSKIQPRVLMLGMHADTLFAQRALRLGVSGYVSRSSGRADLEKAIKTVLLGQKFFPRSLLRLAETQSRADAWRANLSAREYQVLLAIGRGKQTGQIASELNLNTRTVSTFKRRIFNKLQLNSTAHLVRYVIDNKLS